MPRYFTRSRAKKLAAEKRSLDFCEGHRDSDPEIRGIENTLSQLHSAGSSTETLNSEDLSPSTSDPKTSTFKMDNELIAEMVEAEINKRLAEQKEREFITSTVEASVQKAHTLGNIKIPQFSGNTKEDVNDFISQYERVTKFLNWTVDKKAECLPIQLQDEAASWYNSLEDASALGYDELKSALKERFQPKSAKWLHRQNLGQRKQGLVESVADFAKDIRKQCQRLELPKTDWVFYFLNGLRPELQEAVVVQQPTTLEQAISVAKLKESIQKKQISTISREDLGQIIAEKVKENAQKQTVAAFQQVSRPNLGSDSVELVKSLQQTMDAILRELRGQKSYFSTRNDYRGQGCQGRNVRSNWGVPVCQWCNRRGHVSYNCRSRLQANDPRIPGADRGGRINRNVSQPFSQHQSQPNAPRTSYQGNGAGPLP